MKKTILVILGIFMMGILCHAQMSQKGAIRSFVGSEGISVSTSATSSSVLRFRGFVATLSTHTLTYGDVWGQTSDNTLWMSTRTVVITDGDATCGGTVCYIKLSN